MICQKGKENNFIIKCEKENLLKIFVMINSSTESFEAFISKKPLFRSKPDFIYKTKRFFIKYPNFIELSKIYLRIQSTEKMKYDICLKFIKGTSTFLRIFQFFLENSAAPSEINPKGFLEKRNFSQPAVFSLELNNPLCR